MTPTHDDLRAQVSAYFDGELPPADEPAVVEHLATCEECQELLGDTVGVHAAIARGPKAETAAAPPVRAPRRTWMIAGVALAAAAALVVVWKATRPHPKVPAVAVALADHRTIEVRLSGGPFADHRPYQVERGAQTREDIPLAALAELERRGDQRTLAAALASAGEIERARSILTASPPSPEIDSDLAALAILAGDASSALELADRALAGGARSAHWNRALALRDLGFPLAAAEEFEAAAKVGDDWSAEAAERARRLREDFARHRDAVDDVRKRGALMIEGAGAALTAADVSTANGPSLKAFHDALRAATDVAAVEALVPLAEALDANAGLGRHDARAALERVRSADFAVRRGFAARYRAVAARIAHPDEIGALVRELAKAGAAYDDIRLGVIVLTAPERARERAEALEPLLASSNDPWFRLLLIHERVDALRASSRDRAEALTREGLRECATSRVDFRCARLEVDLGEIDVDRGAIEEASASFERAVAGFAASGDAVWEDNTRVRAADLQRVRGNWNMARAGFDEARRRITAATPCFQQRTLSLGLAEVARYMNDLALARSAFPSPTSCDALPDAQSLVTVVDLALQTGDADDRARARAWVEAARPGGDPLVPIVEGRLDVDADPVRARTILTAGIPGLAGADPAFRTLAYRSLARAASTRNDWSTALADADAELDRPAGGSCQILVNPDDRVMIVAVRGSTGATVGERFLLDDPDAHDFVVPATIVDTVAGCPTVAVIARPPLHGRSTILPPTLPWAFVTAARPSAAAAGAPRAVIIADAEPPAADVRLPRLATTDFPPDALAITGTSATPSRVLAELSTATYAELHAHGIANLAEPGTSFLALSPDRDGTWQLTAAAVAKAKLAAHPVIVLGACKAAATTPRWDARWSLPDAFLTAGARAVIAADVDLPDREAAALFARLRARLAQGEAPAAALAAERTAAIANHQAWAAHLMVFE